MVEKFTKKIFLCVLLFALMPAVSFSQSPTEEQILASIEKGVPWLVEQQNNGSWGSTESVAYTGFALMKLCDYATEQGYSPFDEEFIYHSNVESGFGYLFSTVKNHGVGSGLCATPSINYHHETYNAAIALIAVVLSKSPDRVITSTTNTLVNGKTFKEVQDEMVNYFAWSQLQHFDGGWGYYPSSSPSDNSHTGYVTLALTYAESEGSVIPTTLKDNLSVWIDYIQNDGSGGSGYRDPNTWVNLIKTGNLLTEMAFVGDALTDARVQAALGFIQTNWGAYNPSIYEWGIGDPQTMYCLMKGLESFGIETISVSGPDDTNWFEVFATDLVSTQNALGYWGNEASNWDNDFLNTCWALFVLEKIVPNKPPVAICQDVTVTADENCEGHATVEDFDGGSYDPDDDQITIEISPAGPYSFGETLVTLTVTDDSGESDECTATVTVDDENAPVPDPLPDVVVECEVTLVPPTATDNCAGVVPGTTSDPTYYDTQGTYTVTWTYDDGNGNVVNQAQTVIVNDITPPVPDAVSLPDVIGECDATVADVPTATDNCVGVINGTTSDDLFYDVQGTYVVTWTFDDGNKNVVTQDQIVIVDDITPPVIETVLEPISLWSPNHKYVHFELVDFVTGVFDNCAELAVGDIKIVKVASDEPEDLYGNGDGKTFDDMNIGDDCMSLDLRSEREGTGNGRVYTIFLELDDGNNNIGTAICMVNVPHDNKSIAVDDGPVYEVMGSCMEKSGIIADKPAEVEGYALTNYPNPFSRSTTIQFTIPNETKVLVKIYNIFGQEIETVVNQKYLSGTHIVKYDAAGLPTGHYLYRLQTTDFSITKKMILR